MRHLPLTLPLALALTLASAAPLAAQSSRAFAPYAAVGAAGPASVLSEGSGVEVRTNTGGFAEVGALRSTPGAPLALGLFARVAVAPIDVRVSGSSYGASSAVEASLGVRGARRVTRATSLRAGLGVAYVHGPDDLRPYSSGSRVHPAADVALGLDLGRAARWSIDLGGAGYYVGSSDAVDQGGIVAGVMLGLRRAL